MITRDQAEAIAHRYINTPDPYWPDRPELVVTRITDHPLGWLIFYDSSRHQQSGDILDALAGNGPLLISERNGTLVAVGTAAPLDERLREAEQRLQALLGDGRA